MKHYKKLRIIFPAKKKKPLKWFGEDTQKTPIDVRAAAGFSDPWGVPEEWGEDRDRHSTGESTDHFI